MKTREDEIEAFSKFVVELYEEKATRLFWQGFLIGFIVPNIAFFAAYLTMYTPSS